MPDPTPSPAPTPSQPLNLRDPKTWVHLATLAIGILATLQGDVWIQSNPKLSAGILAALGALNLVVHTLAPTPPAASLLLLALVLPVSSIACDFKNGFDVRPAPKNPCNCPPNCDCRTPKPKPVEPTPKPFHPRPFRPHPIGEAPPSS